MLLLWQFAQDVAYFVVAAPLHRLPCAKHLIDGSAQGLGPVNDRQVLAVRRKASVLAQRLVGGDLDLAFGLVP